MYDKMYQGDLPLLAHQTARELDSYLVGAETDFLALNMLRNYLRKNLYQYGTPYFMDTLSTYLPQIINPGTDKHISFRDVPLEIGLLTLELENVKDLSNANLSVLRDFFTDVSQQFGVATYLEKINRLQSR